MIISKSNLQCVHVTKHDKIPALENVVIEPDGSTVGSNGKSMLLVSPVSEKVRENFPLKSEEDPERLIFSQDTAKQVLKNMPKDTKFGGLLEHCRVELNPSGDDRINFETTDGRRSRYIVGKRWDRRYIDYKKILRRVNESRTQVKVVVNLRRLITLLDTIDKACPDSTANSAVFIEFTEGKDIVIRAQNHANGQRAIGVMQSYKGIEGKWMEQDKWERSLYELADSDNNLSGSDGVVSRRHGAKLPKTKKRVDGAKIPKNRSRN